MMGKKKKFGNSDIVVLFRSKSYTEAIKELDKETIKKMADEIPEDFDLEQWNFMQKANEEYFKRTGKSGRYIGTVAEAIQIEKRKSYKVLLYNKKTDEIRELFKSNDGDTAREMFDMFKKFVTHENQTAIYFQKPI